MENISPFDNGTLESIARRIGDLYTGSQLTGILNQTGVQVFDPGQPVTKWYRIYDSVSKQQTLQGDGRPLLKLLSVTFDPRNLSICRSDYDVSGVRAEVNTIMSLDGFRVRDDGAIVSVCRTSTLEEARRHSNQLRTFLEQRGAHHEVLKCCRPELLKNDDDYYEAVYESIKGLAERVRQITGIELDGRQLFQTVFSTKNPKLRINDCTTETERNEQTGIRLLAEGLFAAVRNPISHNPRLKWYLNEQDALDYLSVVSFLHRKIDKATTYPLPT